MQTILWRLETSWVKFSNSNMRFHPVFFVATVILFAIEVLIATLWKDFVFLRSYFGDVLVVILIYTFVLSFFNIDKTKLIVAVLIFSVLIEVFQYFHIADLLGLKPESIPYIVVGNSFSWIDILCYAVGCLLIWIFNLLTIKKGTNS